MSAVLLLALALAAEPTLEARRYRLEVQLDEIVADEDVRLRAEAAVLRARVREASPGALEALTPEVLELAERAGTSRRAPVLPRWGAHVLLSLPALIVALALALASWRRGRRGLREARRRLVRARP